jgi:hypothetical protein
MRLRDSRAKLGREAREKDVIVGLGDVVGRRLESQE